MADKFIVEIDLRDNKATVQRKKFESDSEKTGKKAGKSIEDGVKRASGRAFSSLRNQLLGVGGAFAAAFAGRAILEAAARQEDAINSLNQSLINAGRFSTEASQQFQDFASQLQENTKIGDEQTLELISLAQTFARTNKEAEQLVQTAVDLSAATGISLDSAIRNLGKTFSGLTGELGEAVPQVRELTAEQLKAGEAVTVLAARFQGAAAAELNTFSGRLAQVTNLFGDLLEEIGFVVTQSPQAVALLAKIGEGLTQAIDSVSGLRESRNVLTEVLLGFATFADGFNQFVIAPIEFLVDAVDIAFKAILTGVQTFIAGFANLASGLVNIFAPNSDTAMALNNFAASSTEVLTSFADETNAAVDEAFGFETTQTVDGFINKMRQAVVETSTATAAISTNLKQTAATVQQDQTVLFDTASNTIEGFTTLTASLFSGFANSLTETTKFTKQQSKQLENSLKSTFVNGISNAIQSMITAVAAGQNALSALGAALIGIVADMAITIGQTTVATGVAQLALIGLPGGAAIAAGLGLIALGTVLKQIAGSPLGGGGVSSSAPAGSTPVTPLEPVIPETIGDDEEINEEPKTLVSLNIQGNVLDRRESGLEIAEVLKETLQTNDIEFT